MSQANGKLPENGLRQVSRYVTDHDGSGETAISHTVSPSLPWQQMDNGDRFCLAYATDQYPVELSDGQDVQTYQKFLENKPGIIIPGGSVLRYVDIAPEHTSPMHRTISLDYGVVIEGEVELILDSGVTQLLGRGDITVQRGTNHAWRNPSKTEWARMLYVLQEAHPLRFNGATLEEDYGGGMDDVRPSKRS